MGRRTRRCAGAPRPGTAARGTSRTDRGSSRPARATPRAAPPGPRSRAPRRVRGEYPPVAGKQVSVEEEVEGPLEAFDTMHVRPHRHRVGPKPLGRDERARERSARTVGRDQHPAAEALQLSTRALGHHLGLGLRPLEPDRLRRLEHPSPGGARGLDQTYVEVSTRDDVGVSRAFAERRHARTYGVAPRADDPILALRTVPQLLQAPLDPQTAKHLDRTRRQPVPADLVSGKARSVERNHVDALAGEERRCRRARRSRPHDDHVGSGGLHSRHVRAQAATG